MSFRSNCLQLILAARSVTKTGKVRTNLKDADCAIIVRLRDLEKTYAHVNMNCSHQIWAAERLGGTSSVQTNLKVTNDTIMQLSCEFGKTA